MKFRAIPLTDVVVSETGFSLDSFHREAGDPIAVERTLRLAQDQGINFFSLGRNGHVTDLYFSAAFSKERRQRLVVAAVETWSSFGDLEAAVEGRLRGASLERLDLLLLDGIEPADLDGPVAGAIARLREAGKIRHAGVSTPATGPLLDDLRLIERAGLTFIETELDLGRQAAVARLDRLQQVEERRLTVLARAERNDDPAFAFLWNGTDRTSLQLSIGFGLSFDWVGSVIPAISSDTDLREATRAPLATPLTGAEAAEIRAVDERLRRLVTA
ncbi:MAG: aldo/keto reductase [Elusimicrobia bacterium]|nr:aldo/keto reductase [Elusimicrobiota bacterium]